METLSPWNPESNLGEHFMVTCNQHGIIATGVAITTAYMAKSDHINIFHCMPSDVDINYSMPSTPKIDEKLYRNQHNTG